MAVVLRGAMVLFVLVLAGCSAPNLDETVAGDPASSIRERIVGHGNWGEELSGEQLDQVAAFIAKYAGTAAGAQETDPGLTLWKANECGACHALSAAGPAD